MKRSITEMKARGLVVVCSGLMLAISLFGNVQRVSAQDADESAKQQTDSSDNEESTKASETSEQTTVVVPAQPAPWILRPYRIRVIVSVGPHANLRFANQPMFTDRVERLISAEVHKMWEVDVIHADEKTWITEAQLESLEEFTSEASSSEAEADESSEAEKTPPTDEFDKTILCTISSSPGRYDVATREWDENSQSLGSFHSATILDHRDLQAEAARLILESFRPLAELETIEDEKIEFLIRAGELFARNPEMMQFQPGDYLVPYFRYLDRQRVVQRIQPIPWTYLKVESITRSRMQVSMTSAFRAPIAGSRRRVEVMAMRIRPHLPATEVLIYPRGDRLNPLVGFRCEVMNRLPTEEDKVEDRLKLQTDRRGIVTIPADHENPVQFLFVYSGEALLARVPLIPGYEPFLEIEVPDDTHRLNVEGEVTLLQSELIDVVATREVLMARTRGAAKKKDWENVSKFLVQLQELPTLENFRNRIEGLEVRGVYEARAAHDRVAESRVKRLCRGIRESAEKHLDPFRIAEFRRQMDEERRNSG
ncbi:hypothetical protein KOR42_20210 [Thalassoglobus neptunius]|uniref:Uncharacterized protein n=1 Tax=Thalassoglobus neptunius TaxID=1938619 RepID=A0A5C5X7J9_9PLAN|nr:hypothetical protein [Thalassoglobus neptunius]TWT58639.1 hypothetical protein KOR42_20210 [Thalassoglobus neptunius]